MAHGLEFKRISIHSEKGKEGMHQDISELKTILHQSPEMTLNLEVTSH